MIHAVRNPIWIHELDEELTIVVGPDEAGNLIEVGMRHNPEETVIVHAMAARPRFTR